MVKHITSLILIFIIIFTLGAEVSAKTYPDIKKNTPTYKAVDHLSDLGVISGYTDGTFQPQKEITRGEATALIARSLGYNDFYKAKKLPFSDVKEGYWAEKFISYCYELKLINGVGDNIFAPADKVTYAQMIKMLVCASGLEKQVSSSKGGAWYNGYISVAQKNGILKDVVVMPNENAPRGDVALLVYNCLKNDLISSITFVPKEDKSEEKDPIKNDNTDNNIKNDNKTDNKSDNITEVSDNMTPEQFKISVVDTVSVSSGFKFSENGNYTPDKNLSAVDFSQIPQNALKKSLVVVIDPGHNFSGSDTGAYNQENGVWEQYITWPIAQMLRLKLERMGCTVIMTKDQYNQNITGDTLHKCLSNRAEIANRYKADLFISIHCNAGGGKGVETYCFSKESSAFNLATTVQKQLAENTGLVNRGVKTAAFVVIKETVMPAILVETAFIDNASDFEFLTSASGQNKISTSVALGVLEYIND